MPDIFLDHVSKRYAGKTRNSAPHVAVDDVTLTLRHGEISGIIGYSGAGKSTLVRLINALELPTSGTVTVGGVQLTGLTERELRHHRLGIGMIFQQFNLFTSRTVWGNVEYPLRVAGVPVAEHQRRISDLLGFVGLADKAHSYPDQLSGGQKQRVGIARALATNPAILLADEPTSALDPDTTGEVLDLLRRINTELGITMVVITHEMEVIRSLAHRVTVMEAGRVVEDGDAFQLFSAPQAAATAKFVSTVVKAVPQPGEIAGLRLRHPGRLVTLSFVGTATGKTVPHSAVFRIFADHGVDFEVVYGGITEVQGNTFGHLTVSVSGARVDAALAQVRVLVPAAEVA